MDAAVAALIGAAVGTAGPFFSAELAHKRQRRADLQQQRHDAYVAFLTAAFRAQLAGEAAEVFSALPLVAIVGSSEAIGCAHRLTTALLEDDNEEVGQRIAEFAERVRHELGIVIH